MKLLSWKVLRSEHSIQAQERNEIQLPSLPRLNLLHAAPRHPAAASQRPSAAGTHVYQAAPSTAAAEADATAVAASKAAPVTPTTAPPHGTVSGHECIKDGAISAMPY